MPFDTWLLFAALCAAASYTPGPNMLLSMTHGLIHGPRRTLATALGLLAGLWVLMSVSTAGFGAILAASETAFQAVKWCGVVYLAYLGWKVWKAPAADLNVSEDEDSPTVPAWRLMVQAFGVSLSNPKAIVFFTALFPQFINAQQALLPQFLILATTFSLIEFSMIMSTASGAGRLAPWLSRNGRARHINRVSGGVMLTAAALLASVKRI